MSEYRPTFDAQAFRNLLLYIAQRNADDPAFGKTRLWKELWLSDFLAFARLGESITGSDYVNMPQGPGPTRGDRVLRQLERERKLVIETRDYHGHAQQRPIAQEDAQPLDEWLTSEQQGIVEDALRQFEDGTASNASDWAHDNSVGWQITSRGERSPTKQSSSPLKNPPRMISCGPGKW